MFPYVFDFLAVVGMLTIISWAYNFVAERIYRHLLMKGVLKAIDLDDSGDAGGIDIYPESNFMPVINFYPSSGYGFPYHLPEDDVFSRDDVVRA